jgi:hypothetical protein
VDLHWVFSHGLIANPDPAVYLDADPDPDPGNQTNAHPDLDPVQVSKSRKVKFYIKYLLKNRSKNIPEKVKSLFLKGGNQVSLVILVNSHAPGCGSRSPIQIRIKESQINADPCESRSTILVKSCKHAF